MPKIALFELFLRRAEKRGAPSSPDSVDGAPRSAAVSVAKLLAKLGSAVKLALGPDGTSCVCSCVVPCTISCIGMMPSQEPVGVVGGNEPLHPGALGSATHFQFDKKHWPYTRCTSDEPMAKGRVLSGHMALPHQSSVHSHCEASASRRHCEKLAKGRRVAAMSAMRFFSSRASVRPECKRR
jgi:hypothetical protein